MAAISASPRTSIAQGRTPARRLGHLLILLPATRWGGTESHTAQLAARLSGVAGLRVSLAAEPGLLPRLAAMLAGTPVALHPAGIGWPAGDPAAAAARQQDGAAPLVAALAPDMLLVPLPWPDAGTGLLRLAARLRLPCVAVAHLVPHNPLPPATTHALRDIDAAAVTWCAVSAPGARRAEACFGLPAGRIAVIDNPAPPPPRADRALLRFALRASLGLRADDPLLLFVGRLERGKGAHLLPAIAAAADMTLACAGIGPLRAELDRRAVSDAGGRLRMLGPVADPTPWYQAVDALVLPSVLEGMPLVFLEAAAAGCPLVATEAAMEGLGPAAPSLARLVPAATAPLFGAALRALLADPEARAGFADRARAEAARRGWDSILPRWIGLLRAAAAAGRDQPEIAA